MATSEGPSRAPRPATSEDPRSTAEIVKDVVDGARTIIRKEIELAKLEIQEGLQRIVQGVAFGAVAGVISLYMLGFFLVAGAKGLEEVWPPWLAWLTVGVVLLLVVIILGLLAKRRIQNASLSPEKTQASVQENVQWAQQQLRR